MEKVFVAVGFGIMAMSFMLSVLIGTGFIWGYVVGSVVTLFGWYFWEE